MKVRVWTGLSAVLLLLAAIAYYAYERWGGRNGALSDDALSFMPTDASFVFFADLGKLRQAPFFSALYSWAPRPQADPDYAQFLKETGFDYERDLDRIAIAVEKRGMDSLLFAVADGRFDRRRIAAYALKLGLCETYKGHEICSVPASDNSRKISFTFWRTDRIALTNDSRLVDLLTASQKNADTREWQTRFERLAGSPMFAVIRQDAAAGAALAAQAPGGFRSPQLSTLLDQLQWITIAGKPDGDRMRVVAEGECNADATAQQLSDLLNGILVLAQAGLNDSKTRKQLDPAAREAYLELVKGADVSRIDRGETKAVRLVFDVTPKFLDAARAPAPNTAPAPAGKRAPKMGTRHK
jgi:hypothetical protein